ncbi:hypothetical protein EBX93_19025, partial [bacterium]|nr:hypothetical protein [bacterium]
YAGNGGGLSIYNATVTISNSTISGNITSFTNANSNPNSITNINSYFSNYGGAIFNNSGTNNNLNITNSTISGNSSGFGGGIYNLGTVTVINSTISGNSATTNGGGIFNDSNGGTLNIANTIIANSTDGASTPIDDYSGGGTVNLIPSGDTNDPTIPANNIVTLDTNTNTSTNTSAWAIVVTSAELNLGPLQPNGGPTNTIALTSSTPAAAKTGGNLSISNNQIYANGLDQRGYTRSATNPSIGAFEYISAPTVISVLPASGPTAGGTMITITGAGFTNPASVTIGGTAATSVIVVNSNTITATTPASIAGAASVLVTTPVGTNAANSLFTYTAAPTPTP